MKQFNFTILLTVLISMVSTKALAYDVAVENEDGVTIYYNYINNSTELEVTSGYYNYYSGDIKIPETVTILNKTRKVTSIGRSAFNNCRGLTSVTIPASVTSIGEQAFRNCYGLTSVTIPASVTSIGESTFNGCSGLTSVTIPISVTSIGEWAFADCSGLASVTIPASVTSIGSNAFYYCFGLEKVIVKDIAAWCGISFGNSSSNPLCYACHLYSNENMEITNLVIPNGVTSIGDWAFDNCYGLTSVTIPASVSSFGSYAFAYCRGLTSVTIPASVTSIGDNAFYNCSGLTLVTISDGVTSIGYQAFAGCSGLTSVTIPASVTSIGSYAFYDCNNLADFVSLIQKPFKVGDIVSDLIYKNGTLYVPKGTIEKYKATDGWKKFVWMEEGNPLGVKLPNGDGSNATETQRYTIGGESINSPQRGLNIMKMSDGTVKKVVVK